MTTNLPPFSDGFRRLYCDPTVFAALSAFHPISFARVLPFQSQDPVVDADHLIAAEEAHLADRNDEARRGVIDAYVRCGLLPEAEAENVKSVLDYFGADFFELMGEVYGNAGMFICALRWYRELIQELETRNPNSCPDTHSVYASVGYCLYSLGLFEEAISWSKSCIGTDQMTDLVCRALIEYEAQLAGGRILAVERAGPRTRYSVSAFDPAHASQSTPRLKAAIKAFAPLQEIYVDWVGQDAPRPEIPPGGYPFRVELDAGNLPRHKMNLIFAICGHADALVERGFAAEARRLLLEAALLEPEAGFVRERINALP
jgi:tetratricopeptide (TPR) repeat protein